ncbi:MAG TPA: TlpA family protein disulfide reductase [Halanaerobiaceae bacterium]|jgi:thiol-disulfide isomerase/thioredoxin|nr:TlpA disulfide reductase family protein [Bacillota bacterium]HHU92106.1 TlpA family protein disulfide reductase [Halanaerobiaceae bacterium]HOA40144.1 TlpA disulfide reductase family protein [Halanaerobiales bacterium]HPZ63848.1 TlpA disulfide reductase family protein [Halanaerobiales bacterium]HQD03692.1 TlpA disulfide reductase family protein [Halanaerobiales bacterium]
MKKRISLTIILLIIVLGAIFFYNKALGEDTINAKIGTNIGDLAPDFTLQKVNGEELTLSKLRGKKVFINFWTTNCPYCRLEMPEIQRLYEEHPEVEILSVNIMENRGKVINFLLTNGFSFPTLLDSKGQVATSYLVRGTPTSYFLDENGIIINKNVGAISYQQMLKMLDIE